MSSKAAKVFQKILMVCAVICSVIGFCYVVAAVLTKITNDALRFFGDNDSTFFDDDEEAVVEPIIVEESDESDCCC